jgi:hypothetical protein
MKSVTQLVEELEMMICRHELDQHTLAMKVEEIKDALKLGESALDLVEKSMTT